MKWLVDRGGLLAFVTLALYIWIAPAHIVDGDNAEFATLGTIGGTAHPSGYPLYLLWLRVTAWLPGESPAHTAAIATAIIAATSILVLHAACRAWGAKPVAATLAVAIFAGSPLVIRGGTRAEVFALNGLVVASVLWLAAREGPLRGVWRAGVLGLVAGLGLANHLTCVLVAPVGILGVVRGVRESGKLAVLAAVGGLVVGLLPYVYLFITRDTPLSWGKVETLGDFVAMITRRDYGGPGAFMRTGEDAGALVHLGALAMTLGRAWLWVPLGLGLFVLVRKAMRGEDGVAWAMLALAWLLAGPLLVLRFNTKPEGFGLYVIQRFHVLPALLLAIPIAVGLTPLVARIRIRERAQAVIASLAVVAFAAVSLPHVARMHTPAVERYAQNVLRSLPKDAVLFAVQDDQYFGIQYVQWALGERQDVVLASWPMRDMPWYADRLAARGIQFAPGQGPTIVRAAEYLLGIGRPVFVEYSPSSALSAALVRSFPSYPYGPLMKLLPRGTPIPPIDAVLAENKALFDRYRFGYPMPGKDDEYATIIHFRYAALWDLLARKLAEAGKREDAAWAQGAARAIGPQP